MNPLHDPTEVFDLELLNPNPTSSKTKDGAVYRVSFEVNRDVWDWFMEADTKGLLLAAKACVVDLAGAAVDKPQSDKGPYGQAAQILHRSGVHRSPDVIDALGGDSAYLAWLRTQPCAACKATEDIQAAHVRRVSAGSGVGIKPKYSAIPLCVDCHRKQHDHGESAIGGKEQCDKWAYRYRDKWAWGELASAFGVDSMTKVEPAKLVGRFNDLGLTYLLPSDYLQLAGETGETA